MTHDELLADINEAIQYEEDKQVWKALRAVVELHKPVLHPKHKYICEACNLVYPCETIEAIEKELG